LCTYVAFAFSTDWKHFGLAPTYPVDDTKYLIARLAVMTAWLSAAALILLFRHRNHPVNWRSFSAAFAGAVVTYLLLSTYIVVPGANQAVIAGSVLFYGLVSGFLCATAANPKVAAIVGSILLALQLLVDVFCLVVTGVLRIH
jgi:hypothetical protein